MPQIKIDTKGRAAGQAPVRTIMGVVADVHGNLKQMKVLVGGIEKEFAKHRTKQKKLIFLGDAIDRGLDTRGVLDFLIQLRKQYKDIKDAEFVFIPGNHECWMADMLRFNIRNIFHPKTTLRRYKHMAFNDYASATFASYGNPVTAYLLNKTAKAAEEQASGFVRTLLLALVIPSIKISCLKMPRAHKKFLKEVTADSNNYYRVYGGYLFMHAGLKPEYHKNGSPKLGQDRSTLVNKKYGHQDLLTDQTHKGKALQSFLEKLGVVLVRGHETTTERKIEAGKPDASGRVRKRQGLFIKTPAQPIKNLICLDTGPCDEDTGALSALILHGRQAKTLQVASATNELHVIMPPKKERSPRVVKKGNVIEIQFAA